MSETKNWSQGKLSRAEWESIEIPVEGRELQVLRLIGDGNEKAGGVNYTLSMFVFLKITPTEDLANYLFHTYLYHDAFHGSKTGATHKRPVLKKADMIRMQNLEQSIVKCDKKVFEFVLLGYIREMMTLREKRNMTWMETFYTIEKLAESNIHLINQPFLKAVKTLQSQLIEEVDLLYLIDMSPRCIEQNKDLLEYKDLSLYPHQIQLIQLFNNDNNEGEKKLVLYRAPTGTGKTLTPLALTKKNRVIYVCAARHVGVALARSAISVNKKIAFAFGCTCLTDIRLHYSAALQYALNEETGRMEKVKDYKVNKQSGRIQKVDNTLGQEVELIICDLESYLYAMEYMLQFNEEQQMILYWDEPTISLEHASHPLHDVIAKTVLQNRLSRIVLASATLPSKTELNYPFEVVEVCSYDYVKSISLIDTNGRCIMPHNLADIRSAVTAIEENPTLLRYIDLSEVVHFLKHVRMNYTDDAPSPQMKTVGDITMESIKLYYLQVLHWMTSTTTTTELTLPPPLPAKLGNVPNPGVLITTRDAHTLTSGPTIYLADDLKKISTFLLQQAQIPASVITRLVANIELNTKIELELAKVETAMLLLDEAKNSDLSSSVPPNPNAIKELEQKSENLRQLFKFASLDSVYVPNSVAHLNKWAPNNSNSKAIPFCSNITEEEIARIMSITNIDSSWKVLLLMGIGVFADHESKEYVEIMKSLVDQQQVYLILAKKEYIDGTNYQLTHGYLGKDLVLTRDKSLQALGRVGRGNVQHDYTVRFRNDAVYHQLFQPSDLHRPELAKMKELFQFNQTN